MRVDIASLFAKLRAGSISRPSSRNYELVPARAGTFTFYVGFNLLRPIEELKKKKKVEKRQLCVSCEYNRLND